MPRHRLALCCIVLGVVCCTIVLLFPALPACASGVLRLGSKGPDVVRLQQELQSLGYALTADGVFGARTQTVLKQFQQQTGLLVDGIAGPATWSAIAAKKRQIQLIADGIYIVQRNDTLRSIAQRLNLPVEELARLNMMRADQTLYVGQALTLPGRRTSVMAPTPPVSRSTTVSNSIPRARVILTFDDCREASLLSGFLRVLDEHSVRAVLFLSYETLISQPELVRAAYRAGHRIENQGSSAASSQRELIHSIMATCDVLYQLTGVSSRIYRPSQHHLHLDFASAARSASHTLLMWSNIGNPDPGLLLEASKASIFDGSVMRFSLADREALDALPVLLEHLNRSGADVLDPASL